MHSAATALLSPQRPRLPCNRCRRLDRNLQPLIGVAIRLPEIHGRTFDPSALRSNGDHDLAERLEVCANGQLRTGALSSSR